MANVTFVKYLGVHARWRNEDEQINDWADQQ
jgi:hypothetical protein